MARFKQKARSPMVEAALGFALGAVAGCVLGATEGPVNEALSQMTSGALLKPVSEGVRTVGPLGLGTLLGATALTSAMTSVVAGVVHAAAMASVLLAARCDALPQAESIGVWLATGLAGVCGSTASGASLGVVIQKITMYSGLVGLLGALSLFTAVKPALHFALKQIWRDPCCSPGQSAVSQERGRRETEAREKEQWATVTVEMEQRIVALERGRGRAAGLERRAAREAQDGGGEKERAGAERKDGAEEETERRTVQETINNAVLKYMDFLAFSGIPMTTTAAVTAGFGLFGFGDYRFVFVVLVALVMLMSFVLLKSSHFNFWMLAGCMGMFANFAIAVLTVHAGQEVVSASIRMRVAGQNLSREDIGARMDHRSTLEALGAGFFVARLCQLGLGATVGGPLVRAGAGKEKVIVGAAAVAWLLLAVVGALAPVLGAGGTAGALLGPVGTAGVSVGAAAALAAGWSSWAGTTGTIAGLVVGSLGMGKWHFVNIGLQLPVAYFFAMTNLF